MSVFAELPDGRRLEFPDGTDPSVIQTTVKKMLAPAQAPAPQGPKPTTMESVAQGVKSPVAGAAQLFYGGFPFNPLAHMNPAAQDFKDLLSSQEKSYQYSRGEDANKLDIPRMAGEFLNPMSWGGVGKGATALQRIANAMIAGGGQGGLRVTDSEGERLKDMAISAGLSTLLPGAWEGAKAVGRGLRNVTQGAFNPEGAAGRLAREAAGPRLEEVQKSLANAEAGQTAQQAIVPSGSTETAAVLEIAKKRKPSDFRDIEKGQQAARVKSIEDVGGSDAALATAKGDRAMAASQLYGDAMKASVKADADLAQIASNPYFKDAVPEAVKVMESRYPGEKPGKRMTEFLQVVKEGLDQKINAFGDTALNKDSKREAVKVQERILEWLDKKNPDFAKARGQYAKDSVPVNQAQVLQLLTEKAKTPLDVAERPGVFASAVKDSPKTVKNATGREYSELSDVLSPEQQKVVDSILKQFQTDAYAKEMARAGMDKAGRLVGDMGHVQGTGMLNRYMTLGTSALRKLASGATDKTMDTLADLAKDPRRLAEAIEKAAPGERKAIIDALMQGQARAIGMAQGDSQ